MPALVFLGAAALVLIALLFVADDKLEKISSPAIVTSQHTGLPDHHYHGTTNVLIRGSPAPAPDMDSEAVLTAQPDRKSEAGHKSEPERHMTIPAEARSARAEAPPRKRPVMPEPIRHEQNNFFDRFSIKGQ